MKSQNVAIIQARMGSSRFPGKMLARLGGFHLIEWVISRVQRASTLNSVVLATSASVADDDLVEIATRLGVNVFRGSESDVLARFVGAAKTSHADNIIRICADNPFIDPGEIDRLVNYFIDCPCDYACNHQDRLGSGYADGFGAEILTYSLLKEIERSAIDTRHREHVTLYLWDKAKEYSIKTITAPADLAYPGLRFDVDEQSDLEYLEKLISNGVNIETPASEVVRIAKANIN